MTIKILNDIRNAFTTSISDEDFIANMNLLLQQNEQEICAIQWNSNETFALSTISIAKYSNIFWVSYLTNQSIMVSKYTGRGSYIQVQQKNKGWLVAGVTADAVGGIVGSITGFTAGIFGGCGAGGLVGYFGGKIIGAAGASGAVSLCHWFANL